ncbi:syndecan-4 [Microcaecilia unicolor]|uniref:Syndecan n=1 Tax=Microcaecilia unicolor TaxID=1415580 RepID=A0A6P7YUM1_9AMPH|nr:syndecan-4 [Microcaecilia unicolor]
MKLWLCSLPALLLLALVSAESMRETETMQPAEIDFNDDIFSGYLPDDEDLIDDDFHTDDADIEIYSGSGDTENSFEDEDGDAEVTEVPIDNSIPDNDPRDRKVVDDNLIKKNEVSPGRNSPVDEEPGNKVSMASTANTSIFEKTEVLAALIAGGVVGLLFAVFLILLLFYRMKKKDEGSYDLGKKPIYTKAATNEFYA